MEKNEVKKLLTKYLRGECNASEQVIVDTWFNQLKENPEDTRLLNEVQEQLLGEKMLRNIKNRLSLNNENSSPHRFGSFFRIAATILLLATIGVAAVIIGRDETNSVRMAFTPEDNGLISVTNSSLVPQKHVLSDGSIINLQPNGTLTFPEKFNKSIREVALTGEAFFDVSKDKSRPFIISANDVTVKVLGTSFNVKAYEGAEEVTVAVITGKVSVSRPQHPDEDKRGEVILTPNQEVVYNTINENFSKKIVASPLIVLAKPTLFEMKYDGTTVDKIFEVMEENYGIDIVYDPKVLSSCSLTTSMAEEGFHERIEIICQAIGAQYEVQDATIVIKSNGCQ